MTTKELLRHNYRNGGNSYIQLSNNETRWSAFLYSIVNMLKSKFGDNFYLVIYWYKDSNSQLPKEQREVAYYKFPYSAIKHLLTKEHLSFNDAKQEYDRWTFNIINGQLQVHANSRYSINAQTYIHSNPINFDSEEQSFPLTIDDEIESKPEGSIIYRTHRTFERNRNIVDKVKARYKSICPKLKCQICGFSFLEKYGILGLDFIEAHHKIPLSELSRETITSEDDFILVCSNCHRMLHHNKPTLKPEELLALINEQSNC